MAIDVATLKATLIADTSRFTAGMSSATATANKAGKRMEGLGGRTTKALAAFAGIAGVATGMRAAGNAIVGFDKEMRNVNSLAQLSEKEFRKLENQVLSLAGKTAQSPRKLAAGLYDLVSSGFKSSDAIKVLKASALAATAGLTTTEVASKAVAGALNAYGLKARSASKVSDILFRTVDQGVITFEELAQGIGPVLPVARKLGVGLAQVGAMTATLTKAGIPAAEAFTYQKGAMVALIKPTDEMSTAFKKLGVESGGELIKKTGSLQGALQLLSKSVGGNATKMAALFPEIRGMTAAMGVTSSKSKDAARDLDALANSGGATAEALKQQTKSISLQWQKFKAITEATVIKAIFATSDAYTRLVAAFKSGDTTTVMLTASLAGLAAGFAAFKIISGVIAGVTGLKAAMIGLNAAMLANPFVIAAAAIVALGVAMVIAYKNSEAFRNIVNGAFASVKSAVTSAMSAVKGALASANAAVSAWVSKNRTEINAVGQAFQNIGRIAATVFRTTIGAALAAGAVAIRAFGAVFRNVLAPAFEFALSAARRAMPGIESVVRGGLQVLQGIVKVFAGIFTLNFGRAFDGLGDIVKGAFRAVVGAIRAFTAPVREAVARIASAALGALKALPGALYSVGTQMIQGMINGVASMVGALVGKVKSIASSAVNAAKGALGVKSPSKVFHEIGVNVGQGLVNGVASMRAKVAQSARENLIFPLEDTIGELERKKERLTAMWESSDMFGRMSGLKKTIGSANVKGKEDDQRRKTARQELRDLQRDLIRTKALSKIDVEIRGLEQARGMRDALRQIGDQLRGKIADAVDKYRQNWQRTTGVAFDAQTDLILANTDAAKELQALRLEQTAESRAEESKRAQDRIAAAMLSGDTVELLEAQKEAANVARSQRITDLEAFVAAESTKISEERAAARQAMEDAAAAAFEDSLQAQLTSELESLEARKQAYATFVRDVQAILGPLGFGFDADAGHEAALASPLPKKKAAAKKPAPKKPRAKRRAHGGLINRGEWSWVGEQGPELVRLPSGSRMFSSQDSAGMGGGVTNVFHITAHSIDPQQAGVAVVRALDEFERRNGARYQRA